LCKTQRKGTEREHSVGPLLRKGCTLRLRSVVLQSVNALLYAADSFGDLNRIPHSGFLILN